MRNLIAVFVLLVSTVAHAEDYIYAGGWSKHFGDTTGVINEQHNFVGYERDDWIVGSFKNSFGKDAYLAGKILEIYEIDNIHLKVAVGGVYGYNSCSDTNPPSNEAVLCPAVAPMLSYERFAMQPTITVVGKAVVVMVKWRFD